MIITLRINGKKRRQVDVPPMKRLLDVIREEAALTGTKEGCGEGECGACSVLMNGELVNSCLVPAAQADGAEILTVEGLATRGGTLHPIQDAFWLYGGAQCGICTPGMLMASLELLSRKTLTEDDVREGLAGNLCRWTGYVKIVESVLAAHKHVRAGKGGQPMPEPKPKPRADAKIARKVRRAR